MSKQTINIGASPNDGTGTPLRTSFDYTNQNFTELYTALGGGVGLPGATTQVIFNDGGTNLAGDAGLVYNKTTDALTVAGLVTAGSASITGDLTVDTSTLKVDSTNDRVGIGTATPGCRVDIVSDSNTGLLPVLRVYSNNGAVNTALAYDGLIGSATLTIQSGTSSPIVFNTNGATERARFNSTGNLAFVSGKGIDFSAVTGGTGTATGNVLNDYEEGTWVPVVADSNVGGNVGTCVIGHASYTKIGRQVSIECYISSINTTGMTAGASFIIRNLPFTAVNGGNGNFYTYRVGRNASTVSSSAKAVDASSYMNFPLYTTNSATTDLSILVSDITSGTSEFVVSVTYFV